MALPKIGETSAVYIPVIGTAISISLSIFLC